MILMILETPSSQTHANKFNNCKEEYLKKYILYSNYKEHNSKNNEANNKDIIYTTVNLNKQNADVRFHVTYIRLYNSSCLTECWCFEFQRCSYIIHNKYIVVFTTYFVIIKGNV